MASTKKGEKVEANAHIWTHAFAFFLILITVVGGVLVFFRSAPPAPEKVCGHISFKYLVSGVLPKFVGGRNDKMKTVFDLWKCAVEYKNEHPYYALSSFCVAYISMQSFAIPGPLIFSILAGALYPFVYAQILVAICATTGASICFLMSYCLGRDILQLIMPQALAKFTEKVKQNKENLFYYMLFLRITPLLPNWFVNIASPIVKIDFKYFFLGTLLGLMPANFFHISTGLTLHNMQEAQSEEKGINYMNFVILFCLQFVALLPTFFKGKLEKMDGKKATKQS